LNPVLSAGLQVLIIVLASLGIYDQISASVNHIQRVNLPDTRFVVQRWIEQNIPVCAHIGKEFYTPPLNSKDRQVDNLGYYGLINAPIEKYDYLVASSCDYARFLSDVQAYPGETRRYGNYIYLVNSIACYLPQIVWLKNLCPTPYRLSDRLFAFMKRLGAITNV
jgi:hypothetical protein